MQIYWGAIPFVVIQVIMVAMVILFPQMVLSSIETSTVDPNKVQIQVPTEEMGTPDSASDIEKELEQNAPSPGK